MCKLLTFCAQVQQGWVLAREGRSFQEGGSAEGTARVVQAGPGGPHRSRGQPTNPLTAPWNVPAALQLWGASQPTPPTGLGDRLLDVTSKVAKLFDDSLERESICFQEQGG